MLIRTVEFVLSVADPGASVPADLPSVAFSGRSNVGKSSLINTLLRRTRRKIAHVSGRPGKTQTLNFFRVNEAFYLVDLPGFGFARVPTEVKNRWGRLIEWYLSSEAGPNGIVHLMDVRRGLTETDREMLGYLSGIGLPTLIVVTKVDKLGRQKRIEAVDDIVAQTGLDADQVLPFSSVTGEGRDLLLGALEDLLGGQAVLEDVK